MSKRFLSLFSVFLFLFFFLLSFSSPVEAQYKKNTKRKYALDPEIGLWLGPAAPLGPLAKRLNTNFGIGFFTRINFPTDYLRLDVGLSYSHLKSDGPEKMDLVPMYAGLIYTLPIKFAMKFFLKFDLGTTYVKVWPEKKSGWLPNLVLGVEGAFPTGRSLFIGLHIDYIFVIETYKNAPTSNYKRTHGHFMHFGISISYKFGQ